MKNLIEWVSTNPLATIAWFFVAAVVAVFIIFVAASLATPVHDDNDDF